MIANMSSSAKSANLKGLSWSRTSGLRAIVPVAIWASHDAARVRRGVARSCCCWRKSCVRVDAVAVAGLGVVVALFGLGVGVVGVVGSVSSGSQSCGMRWYSLAILRSVSRWK